MTSRTTLLIVSALVLGACSGSGDTAASSTASASSDSAAPTATTAAPDQPAPEAPSPSAPETLPSATTTGPATTTTTTEPPLEPVRIEDALVDPQDVLRLASFQRAVLPRGDDPPLDASPDRVPSPDGPCAFSWTEDDSYGPAGDVEADRRLRASACEFATEAQAEEYEARLVERYSPDIPIERWIVTALDLPGWSGRSLVYEYADSDRKYALSQIVGRRGLRVFSLSASMSAVEPDAEGLARELAAAQDARLSNAGIEPDQPGAGFVGQADRLSIDDGIVAWNDLVAIVGRDPESTRTRYEQSVDKFHDPALVEWGSRTLDYSADGVRATLTVTAYRHTSPTDATLAMRRAASLGHRPVPLEEPVPSERVSGGLIVTTSPVVLGALASATAHLASGDRRYQVTASGSVTDDDADLVDRVLVAVVARLERDGLLDPPGQVVPVVPVVGGSPLAASALADAPTPSGWRLESVRLGRDPRTGATLFDITYDTGFAATTAATIAIGTEAPEFLPAFAPDAPPVADGEWSTWATASTSYDVDGEQQQSWQSYAARFGGGIGLVVVPDNVHGRSADDELDEIDGQNEVLDTWAGIAAHLAESIPESVSAEAIGAEQRVLRMFALNSAFPTDPLTGARPFPFSELGSGRTLALGAAGVSSPTGAVADWHRTYDDIEGYDGGRNALRIVRFASAADAETFASSVAASITDPVPVDGSAAGGIGAGTTGEGVAVAAIGEWVFVVVIRDHTVSAEGVADDPVAAATAACTAWLATARGLALISS